jgi:hypothetical protein
MTDADEGRITDGRWLGRDTPDESCADEAVADEVDAAAAADIEEAAADEDGTKADRPAAVHSCATRECVALLTAFRKSTRRTGTPPPAAGMPCRRSPLPECACAAAAADAEWDAPSRSEWSDSETRPY